MTRPRPEQVDALCCACGNVRTVARQAVTLTHNRELVCRPCGARTMHAIVLPSGVCDWRERENATRPAIVHVDPLDAMRSLGWIVVEVEGLAVPVAAVRRLGLVVVRVGASEDQIGWATDRLLESDPPAPSA